MHPKHKIICIVGPTASGKSALAVELARKFNGEIISADSRQVYKGMDIGSGKITKREMRGVPHHLLDVASPKSVYTASHFKRDGQKAIKKIISRGKLPIIVGGTGFYIDTLLGRATLPEVPPNKVLRKKLSEKTPEQLFKILQKLDPARAKTIDRHNGVRLIRAVEIATALGKVPHLETRFPSDYKILWIGLNLPPEKLKKNIHIRLQTRLKQGMVTEVRRLRKQGVSWKRLYDLGLEYRYISLFLQGKLSREEMLSKIKSESWHYAKRQMTWFKRNKEITWFSPSDKNKIEKTTRMFLS